MTLNYKKLWNGLKNNAGEIEKKRGLKGFSKAFVRYMDRLEKEQKKRIERWENSRHSDPGN